MKKEIIKTTQYLPATVKELTKFILIGREKLVAVRAHIRAIDKIELATGVRKQKLEEGQMLAGALLDAETKLGDILGDLPPPAGRQVGKGGRGDPVIPKGISHNQSSQFQLMAEHKDIVEQVKAEAEENEDLPTRNEVLKRIKTEKHEKTKEKQKKAIEEGTKEPTIDYDIIVIDPPWPYGTKYDSETRRVSSPYPEMSLSQIGSIQLPSKKDCILWLWTTHRFIWNAKLLLENWGFEYKAILTWDKEKIGMGNWLRMQCEFCLLGIKGKPLWEPKDLRDIIREARGDHSAKPDSFYKMIDDNFVGSKLDYFSRRKMNGWTSYGTL